MNWFVNQNTCFPAPVPICALYSVHSPPPIALPPVCPCLSSRFIPPPCSARASFSRCVQRCLRLSVFTAYILSRWRCGVMAPNISDEKARGTRSGVCVWTVVARHEFPGNYNYSDGWAAVARGLIEERTDTLRRTTWPSRRTIPLGSETVLERPVASATNVKRSHDLFHSMGKLTTTFSHPSRHQRMCH